MHIREITRADLPAFGEVVAKAMWNDEAINYISPHRNQYPDSNIRYCIHRAKVRYYRGEHMFVAVSDSSDSDWTGEEVMVGYASYSTTVKTVARKYQSGWLGNTFERKALEMYETYTSLFKTDWSGDPVARQAFRQAADQPHFEVYFENLPEQHRKVKGDQHWELELLGTHPDYRRRGVGKLLLQWGFERATSDMVPLVLLASLTGEKLYLSTGFKEVSRQEMYLGGGKGRKTLVAVQPVDTEAHTLSWALMAWEPPRYRDSEDKVNTS